MFENLPLLVHFDGCKPWFFCHMRRGSKPWWGIENRRPERRCRFESCPLRHWQFCAVHATPTKVTSLTWSSVEEAGDADAHRVLVVDAVIVKARLGEFKRV
jgi:hypothetical protein